MKRWRKWPMGKKVPHWVLSFWNTKAGFPIKTQLRYLVICCSHIFIRKSTSRIIIFAKMDNRYFHCFYLGDYFAHFLEFSQCVFETDCKIMPSACNFLHSLCNSSLLRRFSIFYQNITTPKIRVSWEMEIYQFITEWIQTIVTFHIK